MTTSPKKFVYYPLQKPTLLQPDCPVYIYAYCLAVQKVGYAAFAQVRLVNRSDKRIHSVFLRIEGKDRGGNSLYELQYVPLVECMGQPHEAFGEEQPLFLPQGEVYSLNIQVLDILFEDGMIWRKQNGHQILTAEQAGWETCTCGMKNPGEAFSCAFCGKILKVEENLLPVRPASHEVGEIMKVPAEEITGPIADAIAEETPEEFATGITAFAAELHEQTTEASTAVVEENIGEHTEKISEGLAGNSSGMIAPVPVKAETAETAPRIHEELSEEIAKKTVAESAEDTAEGPVADPDNGMAEVRVSESTEEPKGELLDQFSEIPQIAMDGIGSGSDDNRESTEGKTHAILQTLGSGGYITEYDIRSDMPTEAIWAPSCPLDESPTLPMDETLPEENSAQGEESASEESSVPWMQETERMLQEFRKRMQARERGEGTPAATGDPDKGEEEQQEVLTKEASSGTARGVMFWVLMVILLIVLGAAAFFGVLYFKGYFG